MQRVCRAWRSIIQASHNAYICLDFSAVQRAFPVSSFQAYVNRSGGNVREVVFSGFGDDLVLPTLVHRCSQLSILTIHHPSISPNALLKVAQALPNLTVLITDHGFSMGEFCGMLKSCASLRKFGCKGITPSVPIEAFTANLRRLKICESVLTSASWEVLLVSWIAQPFSPLAGSLSWLALKLGFTAIYSGISSEAGGSRIREHIPQLYFTGRFQVSKVVVCANLPHNVDSGVPASPRVDTGPRHFPKQ